MITTNQLHPSDREFIITKPDADFSPERNKAVIEETIKKTRERVRSGYTGWRDKMGERVHAVASYLIHSNRKDTPLEKYFTKQYLAYLRGDDIRNMLMTSLSQKAWQNQRIISRGKRG